ncbi:MAG TPA: hypothetical protein VF510_19850 [Ktedonobacterales bacterium]
MTNTCGIQDPQGPIAFGTTFLEGVFNQCLQKSLLAGKVVIGESMTDRGLRSNVRHGRRQTFACKDSFGGIEDFFALRFAEPLIGCFGSWHLSTPFILIELFSQNCNRSKHVLSSIWRKKVAGARES